MPIAKVKAKPLTKLAPKLNIIKAIIKVVRLLSLIEG